MISRVPPSPPSRQDSRQVKDLSSGSPTRRLPVVDRSKVPAEVVKAAEGMEGMFLDYMMKVMRQTVPKNEMDLESPATEVYRGLLDSEYAQQAVRSGGVGLTDQIIAYLEGGRYTEKGPEPQK